MEPVTEDKILTVRVLKSSRSTYWYSTHIDEMFTVTQCENDENDYRVINGDSMYLKLLVKVDCEVIHNRSLKVFEF